MDETKHIIYRAFNSKLEKYDSFWDGYDFISSFISKEGLIADLTDHYGKDWNKHCLIHTFEVTEVIIPSGWSEVPLNTPVYHYDLQWNRQLKKWQPVTHYGDYQKRAKRRYIIRENAVRERLSLFLRYFPNNPISSRMQYPTQEKLIAYILWLAGFKEINHTVRYICGDRIPECLDAHINSIVAKPYISHPICGSVNLLWYLIKKIGMGYSGGAGGDNGGHIQISTTDKEHFLSKIVINFNALKNNFKLNEIHNSF